VICPRCQTRLSDDAAICDSCDFIIDAAFLGENITNEADAPPVADRTRVRSGSPPPSAPAAAEEEDAGGSDALAPAVVRRSALERVAAPPASVNEAVHDLTETFRSFSRGEQFSAGGAMVFLFSLGLPWQWTEADDMTIGLFAGAAGLGLFAAVTCVAPFIRRRAALRPYLEWISVASLSSAAIVLAGTVIFLLRCFDKVTVSMAGKMPKEHWKMYPEAGLFIGLIAAVAMLGGALFTFRDRNRPPD